MQVHVVSSAANIGSQEFNGDRKAAYEQCGIAAAHATPAPDWLKALIAAQKPGYALTQRFYNDPEIFAHEMRRIAMRHWFCAGHQSMVAEPGDFFTVELGSESVIIVRGKDRKIRALVNVCRHRGSRVCMEKEGRARGGGFTCPYHAWNYGLAGELRSARLAAEDFDKSQHGLKELRLEVIEGLIFITFAEEPLGLDHVRKTLNAVAGAYGWADAKVAHRETYAVTANWKLTFENYTECYHCAPSHQEFSKSHAMGRGVPVPERFAEVERRALALGISIPEIDHWADCAEPGQSPAGSSRSVLNEGFKTGSEDGRKLAPLMGRFSDYDGGITFFDVLPFSDFLAYPDHGLIYRFVPKRVDLTEMEVIWLVKGDAKEGVDYDLARLTWLWQVTSLADKRIVEMNQLGVNSAFYEPGPYVPLEIYAQRFLDWYLREIG